MKAEWGSTASEIKRKGKCTVIGDRLKMKRPGN